VFFDGSEYWLGDGYHRWHAAREADITSFRCDIRQGSRRDAILFACSANVLHGLRRKNADKHRAVMTLLNDAEWSTWSDNVIAEKCGVSHPFVGKLRSQLVTVTSSTTKRRGKDGKSRRSKQTPPANPSMEEPDTTDDDSPPTEDVDDSPRDTLRPGVIERFKPFWDSLDSQERTTLWVWLNAQMN
jgi:hypothetical protein